MDETRSEDSVEQPSLQYGKITETIIGCAFEVINELGAGFVESIYQKALAIALQEKGFQVQCGVPIHVYFRNRVVGEFVADQFVESKVLVELKAVKAIAPEHQAQVINYLKATGVEVGLLINFGNPKLEFKRFTRSKQP
jgi:GxxExxY protein